MSKYIDADALIDFFNNIQEELGEYRMSFKAVNRAIDARPTIEPKRGEWITIDTKVISVPVYWNEEQRQSDERGAGISEKCECSVCGWRTNFMGYKKLGVNKSYNFCPNCGADMRERKDERDYL